MIPVPERCWDLALANIPAFMEERSELEELFHGSGNLYLRGVKYYPEISARGVEYGFGMSKRSFRRNNDCKATNLNRNVMASISMDVISMLRLWKFCRRADTYKHMYRKLYSEGGVGADLTYQKLEQLMKGTKTTHRNIMELDRGAIEDAEEEDGICD